MMRYMRGNPLRTAKGKDWRRRMTKNVMIVGVGGQGSLLASKLLGKLLLNEGYDVKVSEVHGMSQRGGSVVTYVRFGEKVYNCAQTPHPTQRVVSISALPSLILIAGQPRRIQALQPTHFSLEAIIGFSCFTYFNSTHGRRLIITEASAVASSSFTTRSHSARSYGSTTFTRAIPIARQSASRSIFPAGSPLIL